MKYIRPDYINNLPETFRDYFNEENFKNKPYPRTLENANDYLLFDVFKAKTTESIIVFSLDKNGGLQEKLSKFTRDNFHKLFNFDTWNNLQDGTKVVALYWLYEEICNELKIYPPKFVFLEEQSKNYAGYYQPGNHSFHFFLSDDIKSAYQYVDTLAHELKHAQFFSKEPTRYMNRLNYNYYFDAPQEQDYDLTDDREKFEYNYDLAFYYQQPNEVESYNYGLKKAKEIFKESNFKVRNGLITNKIKASASLEDLNYFRNANMDRRTLKKVFELIFKDKFKEQMDKHFLLKEFLVDVSILADQICALDPNVKQKGDKLFSENESPEMLALLEQYYEALKNFYAVSKEIQKDKKKLFKQYKQLLADESIEKYRT